jgi:uncharacterized membrane protein
MWSAEKRLSLTIIVFAVLAASISVASSSVLVRSIVAIPLFLFLPGHSVLHLVTGRRRFDLENLVLAVGLSMAIAVLGGVALNLIGALSLIGWAVLSAAVTVGATAAGSLTAARSVQPGRPWMMSPGLRPAQWMMCLVAVLLAFGSVELVRSGAEAQHEYAFTEFWMVPKGAPESNMVTIGIRNSEKVPTTYDIALFADGANVSRRSGITLQPGKSWLDDVALDTQLQHAERVQAWLFRSDAPYDVYRKVWISGPGKPAAAMKEQG